MYASAWVAAEDGVLVTNWHVFEDLEEGEVFGAVDYKGNVYPLIDFLGGDKVEDVAVVKINARGLRPLPLAESHAEVGSWVSVLCHPGYNSFVFTQGTVTRYSTTRNEEGKREWWMGVTADYGHGSSGSPVLNKYGAVVGMAATSLTIDGTPGFAKTKAGRASHAQPPVAAPPNNAEPQPNRSSVQIILKMAIPGPVINRSFAKP
jgi:serine protease Do